MDLHLLLHFLPQVEPPGPRLDQSLHLPRPQGCESSVAQFEGHKLRLRVASLQYLGLKDASLLLLGLRDASLQYLGLKDASLM